MKKSYKKLYLLEGIVFLLLLINGFGYNFLSGYGMVIFIGVLLVIFKKLFGFEKENTQYIKGTIYEIVVFALLFFLLYYISGIMIGFSRTTNYLKFYGIITYIIPFILTIIGQEYLRHAILKKSEGCNGLLITTIILFIYLTMTNILDKYTFNNTSSFFMFFSLTLMPVITENILCTYTSIKVGYKPNIIYRLIFGLYPYVLPIVPNPNEYLKSVIDFLLPLALLSKIRKVQKRYDDEELERDYRKKTKEFIGPMIAVIVLVYFVSGYFKYYAIAVATESMDPAIKAGDVAVVDQRFERKELEVGDIIAFRYNGNIIIHRVYKMLEDNGQKLIYTKGDANKDADGWNITEEDIVGKVVVKVNWIGLPTVWINKMIERGN